MRTAESHPEVCPSVWRDRYSRGKFLLRSPLCKISVVSSPSIATKARNSSGGWDLPENKTHAGGFFSRQANTGRSVYFYPSSNLPSILLFSLFLFLGLVLLQKNVPRLQDRWRLEKEGIPTSGVIESTDGGKRCTRSITVRYTVKSEDRGQHMWHRSFDTTCSPYQAGQTAAVVYLPAAPSVAILGPQEAGIPRKQVVVGAGIGAFLTVFGGVYALKFCFRRRRGLNLL